MTLLMAAILEVLGVALAVLTALGVLLVFGLFVYDLADRRRRAAKQPVIAIKDVGLSAIQPSGLGVWDEA
jgi:hypothetical protein